MYIHIIANDFQQATYMYLVIVINAPALNLFTPLLFLNLSTFSLL